MAFISGGTSYYYTSSSSSGYYRSSSSSLAWGTVEVPSMASNERYYVNEYIKIKEQIDALEKRGEGESKKCGQLRSILIQNWNKMTAVQQKEIANKYISERT